MRLAERRDERINGVEVQAAVVIFCDCLGRPEPDVSNIRKHRLPRPEYVRDTACEPESERDNIGMGGVGHQCVDQLRGEIVEPDPPVHQRLPPLKTGDRTNRGQRRPVSLFSILCPLLPPF